MSTKLRLESVPKSIADIYYLANTPSFLYDMLRGDFFVQSISNESHEELINEFETRSREPITSMEEMSLMYAILVALTFKEKNDVSHFFEHVSNIKYEWFADIAKLYIANYTPAPLIQSVNITEQENLTLPTITTTSPLIISNF